MTAPAFVRLIEAREAEAYRALMLQAYEQFPEAFTSSVDERAALPLSWWAARLTDPSSSIVGAFAEDSLVGAAGLTVESPRKASHKAFVFGMFVAEHWQGRGAGRDILSALFAEARKREGLQVLQLTVTEGNTSAITLYERAGFERWGIEPRAVRVADRDYAKLHYWRAVDRPGA